jgi:hypothetical protein
MDELTPAADSYYLREENRVLREQLGGRRVRFNDDQRRRLAARTKCLGLKVLDGVATIVTPDDFGICQTHLTRCWLGTVG